MTTREMLLFNSCFTGKVNSVALLINKVISTRAAAFVTQNGE